MTTTLRTSLPESRHAAVRTMLVEEAARSVPAARAGRAARPRYAVPLAAGASLAAVAAVSTALLVADPAAPPAYASWTATPSPAPSGPAQEHESELWASVCSEMTGTGLSIGGVPADEEAALRRDVLVDRRGDFVFCVDVHAGSWSATDPLVALAGLKGPDDLQHGWGTNREEPLEPPAADRVALAGAFDDVALADSERPGVAVYREVFAAYGVVGEDVTGVDLVLADGTVVVATVQQSLFGAWWPNAEGDRSLESVRVRTAAGSSELDPAQVTIE